MGFLRIVGSTEQGSNRVKAGGKTYHAPRILPVTGLLLKLLDARKAWLKKKVNEGTLISEETGESAEYLDLLPIVCKGQQYGVRCGADDLTRRAKTLLKEIHLDEDILEEANELLEQRFANAYEERDVTAYLFRRNFATHMEIIGLDTDTIHYLMGHVFDDEEITKARYTNGDTLRQIGEQMRQRPIIHPETEQSVRKVAIHSDQSMCGTGHGPAVFTINPDGKTVTVTGMLRPRGASKLVIALDYEKAPETGEIVLSPEKFQPESEFSEKVTYRKIYRKKNRIVCTD